MSTIVLRLVKGVPLTNAELDDNFSNLNTDKLEAGTTATLINKTINLSSNTFVATSAQMATAVSDKTGSGALVFATSPTLVTPALGTPASGVVTNLTGTASININGTVGATTATTGAFTTLTTSSTVTINGGTANGVTYLNGSKVLTTGTSFVVSGGNVGIATTTPSNSLQVNGGGITIGSGVNGTSGQLFIDSGTDGSSSSSIFGRGNGLNEWFVGSLRAFTGSGALGMVDYVYGSNPRVFYTNGIERMRILGSGNVGIGTLTPTELLDVNGNLAITGSARRITGDFSGAVASRVAFKTSTVNDNTIINALPNGTAAVSRFRAFNAEDPTNAAFADFGISGAATIIQSSFGGTGSYLPMSFFTGGSERVRIDTSGNVTVGPIATLPNSTFAANAGVTARTATASAITPYLQLYNGNSGTDLKTWRLGGQGDGSLSFESVNDAYTVGSVKMTLTNAGNLGIGTSSPVGKVQINAPTGTAFPGSIALAIRDASSPTNGFNFNLEGISTGDLSLTRTVSGTSTAVMTFARASGNVGIGSSSPAAHLQVYGAGTNSSNWTNGDATGAALLLQDSGTTSGSGGQLLFGSAFGVHAGIKGLVTNGTGPAGDLLFQTRGASGNVLERMRIDSAGNVGIGTNFSAAKLDVYTNTSTGFIYPMFFSANNSASAKTNYLQLGFSVQQNLAGSETGGFDLKALRNNTPVYLANYGGAAGSGTWKFYTEGTERLVIDSAGNTRVGGGLAADTNGRFIDIYNTGASAGAFAIMRLITQEVASASTISVDIVKYKNGIFALNNNDTNAATATVFSVGASERLRIDSTGNLSSAGGQYRTRYYQVNSFIPNSTNWIRLCTLPGTNQGQMVDFIFGIPGQHILFRVKFGKTTAGGLGGGGVLEVELLGSYVYNNYTPFDWRISDGGTNGPSHIDIRFPNNAGETINSRINVISSYFADAGSIGSFPMTNLGSGTTGGSYSNMGSAGAGGFTKQWFRMTGTKYVFYDNNMAITSGATPPTA